MAIKPDSGKAKRSFAPEVVLDVVKLLDLQNQRPNLLLTAERVMWLVVVVALFFSPVRFCLNSVFFTVL